MRNLMAKLDVIAKHFIRDIVVCIFLFIFFILLAPQVTIMFGLNYYLLATFFLVIIFLYFYMKHKILTFWKA